MNDIANNERDKILKKKSDDMRARTGWETSGEDLVVFLYLLARDEVSVGLLEEYAGKVELKKALQADDKYQFTNGHLARWAKDLAERLML